MNQVQTWIGENIIAIAAVSLSLLAYLRSGKALKLQSDDRKVSVDVYPFGRYYDNPATILEIRANVTNLSRFPIYVYHAWFHAPSHMPDQSKPVPPDFDWKTRPREMNWRGSEDAKVDSHAAGFYETDWHPGAQSIVDLIPDNQLWIEIYLQNGDDYRIEGAEIKEMLRMIRDQPQIEPDE